PSWVVGLWSLATRCGLGWSSACALPREVSGYATRDFGQRPATDDQPLMSDTFQLEIVTPDKMVVKDVAEEMQITGKNGYFGIVPGHAPLITELAVGEISYRKGGQTYYLAVAW